MGFVSPARWRMFPKVLATSRSNLAAPAPPYPGGRANAWVK
jgi:hypothetical protein